MDVRVRDLAAAQPFCEALLPALGFTERHHGGLWRVWATADPLPGTAYFGIAESAAHAANENRIAFWVAGREEVERLAAVAREAGAPDLSGPKEMPYGPGYSNPPSSSGTPYADIAVGRRALGWFRAGRD